MKWRVGEKQEEEEDEAQPSILTLKNGRPGAFNDPCVSDTGEGADDTGYRSPQHTHSILTSVHTSSLLSHI